MNMQANETDVVNEMKFELKYCERCGGLWLRPVGGEQIYCAACGRAMAEMPPVSHAADAVHMQPEPRWGTDEDQFEGYQDYGGLDLDGMGGVA
jgi:Zn-finger nucleic acid-binding protein